MQIFIAWHYKHKAVNNDQIADEMAQAMVNNYQSLIKQRLDKFIFTYMRTGLIYISEKSLSQNSPFLQTDKNNICFSVGAPTGIDRLLNDYNIKSNNSDFLIRLKELFGSNGFGLINKISPPFMFGFIDRNKDSIKMIHDGLGFEQSFIYEDDDCWICSNKCWPIIKLSGKPFTIDDIGWRQYFLYGWFPFEYTPFKEISAVGMGKISTCCDGYVSDEKIDCFQDWLRPLEMGKEDILEFSRISFNESVKESAERYTNDQVIADLSGGRDTRMILSSILNQNIDCIFNTNGDQHSADVKIAEMIEKKFSIKIKYQNKAIDNIDKKQICTKISRFVNWQDGFNDIKSCKYISNSPVEGLPSPIFAGIAGGNYRADNYPKNEIDSSMRKIKLTLRKVLNHPYNLADRSLPKNIKSFLKRILWQKPQIVRSTYELDNVRKLVFQEGCKYGLMGNSLFDYYNFIEPTRRWASANAAIPYSGYLLPFLNIGLIKGLFSLPEEDRTAQTIHKYITHSNSKGLNEIPYDTDLISADNRMRKTPYGENVFWASDAGRSIMSKILNQDNYLWNSILNKDMLNKMITDHFSGKSNCEEFFWKVAGFDFWYERFCKQLNT